MKIFLCLFVVAALVAQICAKPADPTKPATDAAAGVVANNPAAGAASGAGAAVKPAQGAVNGGAGQAVDDQQQAAGLIPTIMSVPTKVMKSVMGGAGSGGGMFGMFGK